MNVSLFAEITDLATLSAAWERVKDNDGAAGGDGETVGQFAAQAPSRLLALRADLRGGRYHPGPHRLVAIPKADGTTRPLSIPCVVDRVVHTALAQVLTPRLDHHMAEGSFGYRPGRSVAQAVERIERFRDAGFCWVVDADIERYFETVPHDALMALLERVIDDRDVLGLIEQALVAASDLGRGLAQGSPLSPLLSNLYLDSFDDDIEQGAVRLVRFADDFVLLCKSQDKAQALLPRIADLLEQRGLRLNPEKTRIVDFAQGFRFLGHLFVRSLALKVEPEDDDVLRQIAIDDARAAQDREDEQAQDRAGWRATQRVLYVHDGKRRLGLRNQSLTVEEDGHELIALPCQSIQRIDLGPDAEAEPQALRQAVAAGIVVQFVDGFGATRGVLAPPPIRQGGLHLDQARLVLEPDRRIALARILVAGRIHNQRALLRRLDKPPRSPALDEALTKLNRAYRQTLKPDLDIDGLLGVEGQAAALYWPALAGLLKQGWTMPKRIRRPPTDPVNAVLSLTAAMLTRDVEALVLRHGLHPGFGVLHGGRDRHNGCVFDLVEEFRAPLAEGLSLYLFNNRMLKRADFVTGDGPARPVRLTGDSRRTIIRTYEQWLDRPVKSPRSGHPVVWRRLIEEQVLAFAAHCRGQAVYAPYRMDY